MGQTLCRVQWPFHLVNESVGRAVCKRTFNSVFWQIIIALEVLLNGTATYSSVDCTQSCSLGTKEGFLSLPICCVPGEDISSAPGTGERPNGLWY